MAENFELFLGYMDEQDIDGAVCVNYVSPDIVEYPSEVNGCAAEFHVAGPGSTPSSCRYRSLRKRKRSP